MAHFAQVDANNIVVAVHSVDNSVIEVNGNDNEAKGVEFLTTQLNGGWYFQTSYSNTFRKQFAGTGYTYDKAKDAFIAPQPYPSWVLDGNSDWQPPITYPADDKIYEWNEGTKAWDEAPHPMG
jgi:hypothetical protein